MRLPAARSAPVVVILATALQGGLLWLSGRGGEPALILPFPLALAAVIALAAAVLHQIRRSAIPRLPEPASAERRAGAEGGWRLVALALFCLAQVVIAVQAGGTWRAQEQEESAWEEKARARLTARVEEEAERLSAMVAALGGLDPPALPAELRASALVPAIEPGAASADAPDAFAVAQSLARAARGAVPLAPGAELDAVLWHRDERTAWTAGAAPLSWAPGPPGGVTLATGHESVHLRRVLLLEFAPAVAGDAGGASPAAADAAGAAVPPDLLVELQIRLPGVAPAATGPPDAPLTRAPSLAADGGESVLQRTLSTAPFGSRPRVLGGASEGMTAVQTVALAPDERGRLLGVRVAASVPPQRLLARADAAMRLVVLAAAWAVALVAGVGWLAGLVAALLAAWIARAALAAIDLFHWVQSAVPDAPLGGVTGALASVVDPAYFATPFGYGWMASTVDVFLTAVLFAATGWAVLDTAARRTRGSAAVAGRAGRTGGAGRALAAGLAVGVALGGGLLLLRLVTGEIVENANPRLVGPQVPYRSLTFWMLHAALLALSGAVVASLTAVAALLRHRGAGWGRGWTAVAAALGGALLVAVPAAGAGGGPGPLAAVTAGALAAGIWLLSRPALHARGLAGQLAVVVLFLLTVAWNYSALRESYGRSERTWLLRKAEQVVQPQEDWITFLLQDALREMAAKEQGQRVAEAARRWQPPVPVWHPSASTAVDTTGDDAATGTSVSVVSGAERGAAEGAELWRNEPAYRLWLGSSLRDLGMPTLIEVDDPEGMAVSLFAAGFLRDFGYEVQARSSWQPLPPPGGSEPPVLVQTERRRYPTGEEVVLRGEIPRWGVGGFIRVELPLRSRRAATLLEQLQGVRPDPTVAGYRPRAEIDRPLLLVHGDARGWLDAGEGLFPDPVSDEVVAALQQGRRTWGVVTAESSPYLATWSALPAEAAEREGEGFLIGVQQLGALGTALDISRLVLLDALLVAVVLGLRALGRWRLPAGRRWQPSFQQRFLAGFLALGLVVLVLAGVFVDRLTRDRVAAEARRETRAGLTTALGQLQGLLAEQARLLAGSEYIADLLEGRLAGQRPVGPFALQQGMVFGGDGSLLLDETLSDLDAGEAAALLAVARRAPLVVVAAGSEFYLGTVIPIDLGGVIAPEEEIPGPEPLSRAPSGGFFFYRHRLDGDLLTGLAQVIQGEVALRRDGEVVLASHPARVFSGEVPLLAAPASMRRLADHPLSPQVEPVPGSELAFTGAAALPSLVLPESGDLSQRRLPAVLSVAFPGRQREVIEQRERTVLYLAGLATLILVAALLLVLLLTWGIFGPVRVLVTATQRLAGGDFDAPLPAAGRDEVGRLAGAFARMRDELHAARQRLEARERFLSTVLERVPVGVLVVRAEGGLAVLNPTGQSILAAFYPDLGPAAAASRLLADHAAAVHAGGDAEWHSVGRHRTLRGRVATLARPDGRSDAMAVFEDVTEFLATKRLALNAELARQVAHEIKNPLTPIQLSAQLLEQAYRDRAADLDAIVADSVRRILEQVELLRSIAGEFSLLGRPGELECAPLDLPELVRQVAASYHADERDAASGGTRDADARVRVVARDIPPVLGHRESLRKVLSNLMQNSLDARGAAGGLVVEVDFRSDPEHVIMTWRDNGTGLAEDVADRLFDPYFSTKSKGTGLGLAICRNLVDKMGGGITLANRPHASGAVAEIVLRRADAAAAAGRDTP
ncbi:MAG: ATP-binding protein [Candidatus Krumholzibacteriia bacterium]